MHGTILVGLTGGIGSGKSTVARMLTSLGAIVVDADEVSRGLTAPGGEAMPAITAMFGPAFVTPEGALDRARMRQLAYADPTAKRQLESIIHPLVGRATRREAQAAVESGKPCVVFDIPLLLEGGHWRSTLDRIMVIDCPEQSQIDRVMARSGWTRSEVEKVIALQTTRRRRVAAADIVLYNQGLSIEELNAEVTQVASAFGL